MTDELETTWDGQPIHPEPPHGAAIVVYRWAEKEPEFLVLHRRFADEPDGSWAWGPPGGARQPGESIESCARRELREETGLELPCRRLPVGPEEWYVYVAEAPPEAGVCLSIEHDRYRWLPLAEAAALCSPDFIAEQLHQAAAFVES